jgi:hypothetical protein
LKGDDFRAMDALRRAREILQEALVEYEGGKTVIEEGSPGKRGRGG